MTALVTSQTQLWGVVIADRSSPLDRGARSSSWRLRIEIDRHLEPRREVNDRREARSNTTASSDDQTGPFGDGMKSEAGSPACWMVPADERSTPLTRASRSRHGLYSSDNSSLSTRVQLAARLIRPRWCPYRAVDRIGRASTTRQSRRPSLRAGPRLVVTVAPVRPLKRWPAP